MTKIIWYYLLSIIYLFRCFTLGIRLKGVFALRYHASAFEPVQVLPFVPVLFLFESWPSGFVLVAFFHCNPTTKIYVVRYWLCGTAGYQKLKISQRIVASLCNYGWNGESSSESEVMPPPISPVLELVWIFSFSFPLFSFPSWFSSFSSKSQFTIVLSSFQGDVHQGRFPS